MNDLLETALAAHGGLDRWRRIRSADVDLSITGAIWYVKHKPDVLKDVRMHIDTDAELVTTEYPGRDKLTVFTPTVVTLMKADRTVIEVREDPERSFEGQQVDSPWDDLHAAYFSGEALWTYLNTPFLFARPDFVAEEVEPIDVDGETCRRLQVTFPKSVQSHTSVQYFAFGADGLLRRHDYTVDILGGATGLNYASEHRDVDGIMVPMKRRVYAYQGHYERVDEPLLVAIDIAEVRWLR
jgi:hypothetical protein